MALPKNRNWFSGGKKKKKILLFAREVQINIEYIKRYTAS